ncbi:ComEC/Rec2 family competence protein [Streptomyces sp. NRRL_ISP-5395]|uniref:ComEC/Rec2 family competence protein n=1 Tax=Streptomyces TaxID=1883 RepID=UPI0019A93A5C|nr:MULTISPECIES: ComEC/Rec2 family competence protein [Streptomyces]MDX2672557.1 ComEC/Rec2 family competence protein [Streptomyces sp. NRRL_ISP-5395]GHF73378.1 membrane protein [Streptomyces griseus]
MSGHEVRLAAPGAGAEDRGTAGDETGPRREGPTDLRLVPPALAVWAAAAVALGLPGRWVVAVAVACSVAALVLLVVAARTSREARTAGRARGVAAAGRAPSVAAAGRPQGAAALGRARVVAAVGAVLLCAATGAAVAGLHGADVRRGPVPGLAREYARIDVDVQVTSDPRTTRPAVRGNHSTPALLLIDAEVMEVRGARRAGGPGTLVRTPVLLMVTAGGHRAEWQSLLPSTRLRLSGRLSPPAHEGERLAAVLRVDDKGAPRIIGPPTWIQRTAGELRAGLREATDGLHADARALLPGLVVGDTSRVPSDLRDAFKATDLTHLLSVSGANLSILLFLLVGPPGAALSAERRGLAPLLGLSLRGTALIGGALTLAFVVVCRPDPSVLRAAACGLITLLAIGTGRRRSLIPALAAAVVLLVLHDPWLSRSYGFLLSVLATGALLTLAPRWSLALRARRVPGRLAEVLAAAAAAQAVCAPVVVVLASRVSLVAVPCNLLAEFAVAPATVLGFAALAVAPVAPPVAGLLAWIASWPVRWIATVARTGAGLPGAEAQWPGGWSGAALLAGLTVVVVLLAPRLARHPWGCAAAGLLLVLAVLRPVPLTRIMTGWPPPDWAFALCDVGQGDAMVLAAGEGTGVVVDAGPDPRAVDRCLRDLAVTRIPLVVLTHFHADHVRGLPGVLRGRAVGAIQTTGLQEPPEQAAFVRRTAAAARVPTVRAVAGEHRRAGPVDWRVLWPRHGPGGAEAAAVREPNDSSVTLRVRAAGGLTLLLLGDLEPPAQRELLRGREGAGPVDVLKVAHHGSAFQDAGLLHSVRPRLALISCGADNPYGHPSARTVGALRAAGARVLRTDTDGPIAVTGTGKELRAVGRT